MELSLAGECNGCLLRHRTAGERPPHAPLRGPAFGTAQRACQNRPGPPVTDLDGPRRPDERQDRPVLVRTVDDGAACTVPVEHGRIRKVPRIAVPDREDRVADPGRVEEGGGGRGAAAVMRDGEQVRLEIAGTSQQPAFRPGLDVPGEQYRSAGGGDAEHAGTVVPSPYGRRGGIQDLEPDLVPFPGMPRDTGVRTRHTLVREHPPHGEPPGERRVAAAVVGVRVAHHDGVDALSPAPSQIGSHDAAGMTGPRVVDENPIPGLDHHRETMPDVEEGRPHLPRSGTVGVHQRRGASHSTPAQRPGRPGGASSIAAPAIASAAVASDGSTEST